MAKYTLEINQLARDKNFKIFSFDYDFYTDDNEIKKNFEQKFIDKYKFHEIGFETIGRFKHYLRATLNEIAPYYKQLYESELKSKNIEFLLNKDYTETFMKDTSSSVVSTSSQTNSYNDNSKGSNIADGVAEVSLKDGGLTSVNSNNSLSNDLSNGNSEGNTNENYVLTGKGNIGTTSSAELLQKWRDVMINIDSMILEELSDLFMLIY